MNIVSLFSGCGGLDLGFRQAGFNVIWANEYDRTIHDTYKFNHPETILDKRDIRNINSEEIPDCDGIIGGPPCQSWSSAGMRKGIEDSRGQLFWEYIRIVKEKQPKFFLAENVKGILAPRNKEAFENILLLFKEIGYNIFFKLLNAKSYEVPQDRQRVIIVGIRNDINIVFEFPKPSDNILTLRDSIYDVSNSLNNHESIELGFSSMFLARNRVRSWDKPSFTIVASARHIPFHPQANKMVYVSRDKFDFDASSLPYKRLTVRECARIQTFPDEFIFVYKKIQDGYKMVGNAVPVNFAKTLGSQIINNIK